jgi:hypothetical protein
MNNHKECGNNKDENKKNHLPLISYEETIVIKLTESKEPYIPE